MCAQLTCGLAKIGPASRARISVWMARATSQQSATEERRRSLHSLHFLLMQVRSEQQSAVDSHGPLPRTQQTIVGEPPDGCVQPTPPLRPVPPQQSEFSKHGLSSLLHRQCPVRLFFRRRQRSEQQSLSRSQRSPFWLPHATGTAAALRVEASARPGSATAARRNPRRAMALVKASKRSVSISRHLEWDERRPRPA
jgi:hypothetical protein